MLCTLQFMRVRGRVVSVLRWTFIVSIFSVFLSHVCVGLAANHIDIDHSPIPESKSDGHQHGGVHLAACNEDPSPRSSPVSVAIVEAPSMPIVVTQLAKAPFFDWTPATVDRPPLFLLHAS